MCACGTCCRTTACENGCFSLEAPDLSGAGLASQLVKILQRHKIDMTKMVGQGYDVAAAMSGRDKGVQQYISSEVPTASYSHCMLHVLNLCLIKATEVKELQAAVACMKAITNFFNDSNKRLLKLQNSITEKCPESSRTRLKKRCETRWVENQVATHVFKELMPAITDALESLTDSRDGSVAGKAASLLDSISTPGFLLCLDILHLVLSVTKPLSVRLQSPNQDLLQALDSVDDAIEVLETLRGDEKFNELYDSAEKAVGEEIPMPRWFKQKNTSLATARDYYRVNVYNSFIDTCLGQLRERFKSHRTRGVRLCALLPAAAAKSSFKDLKPAVEINAPLLNCSCDEVEAEFLLWQRHWLRRDEEDRPKTVLDALGEARAAGSLPAVSLLLHIFATLPVTTATNERSFSALKHLKTYLRSTMKEQRLNGLAMLFVHKDMTLDREAVVNQFAIGNRRLALK